MGVEGRKASLEAERGRIAKHLNWVRTEWGRHIRRSHPGSMPTTCHPCGNYRQGVMADEANIQDINRELRSLR